jgi:hypothetical protein
VYKIGGSELQDVCFEYASGRPFFFENRAMRGVDLDKWEYACKFRLTFFSVKYHLFHQIFGVMRLDFRCVSVFARLFNTWGCEGKDVDCFHEIESRHGH